jgi:hypothetical protein
VVDTDVVNLSFKQKKKNKITKKNKK